MTINQEDLRERIELSLRKHYYKGWYQRWWGRLVLFGALLLVVLLTYFLYLVLENYRQLTTVDIKATVEQLKLDKNFSTLITADDPRQGSEDANIVIVAFEDFQCPYSKDAQPIIKEMLQKYGDRVLLIHRDFPLSPIHSEAQSAAEAAACANEQGQYLPFHEQLFVRQDELSAPVYRQIAEVLGLDLAKFNLCFNTHKYQTEVAKDYADGSSLGVYGTPTFFVNGQIFPGNVDMNFWDKVIPGLSPEK